MDMQHLSDRELLAELIGRRAAQKLYGGMLTPLFTEDLFAAPPHRRLVAAKELVTRLLREGITRDALLASPAAVRSYLQAHFVGLGHEAFLVLFIDAAHRLIAAEELFRGTLTQTPIFPREVAKRALAHNAAAVIFAHNHPSGACEPSHADRAITDDLAKVLSLIDVDVLDHFIVAGKEVVSMAERGEV